MNHASLFTGIGGFDFAAQCMGWRNIFQVEIDKFCQEQLQKRFPSVDRYSDVKEFDASKYRGAVDVISGGDPCQPHSVAGLGKGTSDVRFLWPEMFRIAQELNVPWIVNENVSGSVANGVLDLKIDGLESIGYTCQAYCIPAESVGALHQRERIWLIAYNASSHAEMRKSREIQSQSQGEGLSERNNIQHTWESVDLWSATAYSDSERFEEQHTSPLSENSTEGLSRYFGFGPSAHGNIPRHIIESGVIRMLNGLPEGMDYAHRNKRLKALGNAIVPQVAFEIFKGIEAIDKL